MKDKLTQISDDLNHNIITDKEAKAKLLILCGVSVALPDEGDMLVDGHKAVMDFRKELKDLGKDEEFADINSWLMGINWLWEYIGNER